MERGRTWTIINLISGRRRCCWCWLPYLYCWLFLLVSDGADQPALAQMHPTNMLTRTDTPPFISPRSTPILTQTPLPRPAPQPMGFITNPTEAYVLGQRYGRNARRGEAPDETLIDTSSIIEDARSFSSNTFNFFPLVTTNNAQLWYKGTSKDKAYLESAFLRRLGVSWWYTGNMIIPGETPARSLGPNTRLWSGVRTCPTKRECHPVRPITGKVTGIHRS